MYLVGILLLTPLGISLNPTFQHCFKNTLIKIKKTKAYIPREAHAVIKKKKVKTCSKMSVRKCGRFTPPPRRPLQAVHPPCSHRH